MTNSGHVYTLLHRFHSPPSAQCPESSRAPAERSEPYFSLDWAIVWEIADANLPELEQHVVRLVETEFPDVAALLTAPEEPETDLAHGSDGGEPQPAS